jgi:hypothetical protein
MTDDSILVQGSYPLGQHRTVTTGFNVGRFRKKPILRKGNIKEKYSELVELSTSEDRRTIYVFQPPVKKRAFPSP